MCVGGDGREQKQIEQAKRKQNSFLPNSRRPSTLVLFSFSLFLPSRTRPKMSLSQLRTAILRHASVGPSAAALSAVAAAAVGIAGRNGSGVAGTSRGYAASTYLDKDAVTSRVLSVVKAFDKVDPGKVRNDEELIDEEMEAIAG